jgi:hypothetical protein
MVRVWGFVIVICGLLGFAGWASDFITMQGERTIYTVECRDGAWAGDRCSGSLVAGQRYRYRALPPHKEVIFWTVGHRRSPPASSANARSRTAQLGLQAERRRAALDHPADGRRRSDRRPGDAAVSRRLEVALDAARSAASRRSADVPPAPGGGAFDLRLQAAAGPARPDHAGRERRCRGRRRRSRRAAAR